MDQLPKKVPIGTKVPVWSDKTVEMIKKKIPERRDIFRKEFAHALNDERHYELKAGYRFYDNEGILSRLQYSYVEKDAQLYANYIVDDMLRERAYGDYYYTYEKEW